MSIETQLRFCLGHPGHHKTLVFVDWDRVVENQEDIRLIDRPDFLGIVVKAPATNWGGVFEGVKHLRYVAAEKSRTEAIAKLREEHGKYAIELKKIADDPEYALEVAMRDHDWTSWASDDHGVWRRGESDWQRIQELGKRVSKAKFAELRNKYQPKY